MTVAGTGRIRQTGQTKDVGFQIGVSRTVPHPPAEVWELLVGPEGVGIWLGAGVELGEPVRGTRYETASGTVGEIRSFHELDRIRLTWRPRDWSHDTTLQVAITGSGDKTTLRLHQEWLADAEALERRRG